MRKQKGRRSRVVAIFGGVLIGALLLAPGAFASTLSYSSGTLSYAAAAGQTHDVTFGEPSSGTVEVRTYDNDPIDAGSIPSNCISTPPSTSYGSLSSDYTCTSVGALSASGADMGDNLSAQGDDQSSPTDPALFDIPTTMSGGSGDDQLVGGDAGNTLNGDDGNDYLSASSYYYYGGTSTASNTLNGGAGDDSLYGSAGNDILNGGDGNDYLDGGPGNDVLNGGAGQDELHGDSSYEGYLPNGPLPSDNDTLIGGDGNDTLYPSNGTNQVSGGTGVDQVVYDDNAYAYNGSSDVYPGTPVNVSLDDQANDGYAGNNSNISSDVEDVSIQDYVDCSDITGVSCAYGGATIAGSSGDNALSGGSGNDVISGGGGADFISGNAGNDTINAVDGYPDRVDCGDGVDTANVDQLDTPISCEVVHTTQLTSGGLISALQSTAPTIAWVKPSENSKLTTGKNILQVNASDARQVKQVIFYAGERTLCIVSTAPYVCSYQPVDTDLGKNTLIAVAVNSSGLTATVTRTAFVPQFKAKKFTATTKPKRRKHAPFSFKTTGKLTLPAGVSPKYGCTGTVTIKFTAGKKTVSTKRAKLGRSCGFSSKAKVSLPKRHRPKSLKVHVSFGGNTTVKGITAKAYKVRTS